MTTNQFPVWPEWETVRVLGQGSFGAVYEIQRDMMGETEKAALKVITIPQNVGDIDTLYNEGYDSETVTATFQEHLKSILDEYRLMRKLNGCSNVVNCDDVRYIQHDDGIGWDIYIKMELLTPLSRSLPSQISDEEVIKIAKHLCNALILCAKHNIVHRDIKPQNIFVSENGDYKLGDFGIAKTVEKTMGGTKTGTYKYMAPEVYNNQPYGSSADIYSLGIVLYWLLNERRLPFLPLPPEKITPGIDETALQRRMQGEAIPLPKNGSAELKQIVLKACSFNVKERYHTAAEMLEDLQFQTKPVPEVPQKKWIIPLAATLAIGVIAASALFYTSSKPVIQDKPTDTAAAIAATTATTQPTLSTEEIAMQALLEDVKALNSNEAYIDSYLRIKESFQEYPNNSEIAQLLSDQEDLISEKTMETANALRASGNLRQAIIAITEVQQYFDTPAFHEAIIACKQDFAINDLAAGKGHTARIKSDGTVVVAGIEHFSQSDVTNWHDLKAVSLGDRHIVGLMTDGTVTASGSNDVKQFSKVSSWDNVAIISAGDTHTVALRKDGSLLATGFNYDGQCDVDGLHSSSPIISVAAGYLHTVALHEDGTVTAVGSNKRGQCDVNTWTDIIAVYAGTEHTLGLKLDGTVVAAGRNLEGQIGVSGWTNISRLSAGDYFTLGLCEDGTVVSAGQDDDGQRRVSSWTGMVDIAAGHSHSVGMSSDGYFVTAGSNEHGERNIK